MTYAEFMGAAEIVLYLAILLFVLSELVIERLAKKRSKA